MPNKNKKQKGSRRPKNSKKLIPNQLYSQSFPRTMKVSLKYSETRAFTTTGALLNNPYVYNLNSIFDPNRTGTGHQPMAFDNWSNLYNRYRVDSCRVTVTFVGSSAGYGTMIVLLANDGTTSVSDITTAVESPGAVSKLYSQGGPAVTLNRLYDLAYIAGVPKSVYESDDRYQSTCTSSPTEVIVLHVNIAELNYSAVPVSYMISLEYHVTLFDPYQLAQS